MSVSKRSWLRVSEAICASDIVTAFLLRASGTHLRRVKHRSVSRSLSREREAVEVVFAAPPPDDEAGLVRELQHFVKAAIAPYKYPRAIEFVADLPKTPTGKIQRYRLRGGRLSGTTLTDA